MHHASTLYEQLPLSIQVEDYSHNEKISYPPDELDASDTSLAEGPAGTLAYTLEREIRIEAVSRENE